MSVLEEGPVIAVTKIVCRYRCKQRRTPDYPEGQKSFFHFISKFMWILKQKQQVLDFKTNTCQTHIKVLFYLVNL